MHALVEITRGRIVLQLPLPVSLNLVCLDAPPLARVDSVRAAHSPWSKLSPRLDNRRDYGRGYMEPSHHRVGRNRSPPIRSHSAQRRNILAQGARRCEKSRLCRLLCGRAQPFRTAGLRLNSLGSAAFGRWPTIFSHLLSAGFDGAHAPSASLSRLNGIGHEGERRCSTHGLPSWAKYRFRNYANVCDLAQPSPPPSFPPALSPAGVSVPHWDCFVRSGTSSGIFNNLLALLFTKIRVENVGLALGFSILRKARPRC